jgi:dienelactone hydrolase
MRSAVCFLIFLLTMGCRPQHPHKAEKPEAPAAPPPVKQELVQPAVRAKVSLGAGKEKVAAFLYLPAGKGPFAAVILVPDEKGMADWVQQRAEALASGGYITLALDLPGGKKRPEDRHVLATVKEAVDYLVADRNVHAKRVGIIGWGKGGGEALQAATQDTRLRAVVDLDGPMLYDPKQLHHLEAGILVVLAGKGTHAFKEMERFREALEKADRRAAGTPIFPNCSPGFLNPTNPDSDRTVIAEVWTRIGAFLLANLES